MQHAVITELETSLAFDAEIDNPPSVKENFTTVFIDGNEVKRPHAAQHNGLINIVPQNPSSKIKSFIQNWASSRKKIRIMLDNGSTMYLLEGCYIRKMATENFSITIYYNSFKEA